MAGGAKERLSFLEWGIAERPLPGQPESGDQYLVSAWPTGALLAAIDGLGHGPGAAKAARLAAATLEADAQQPLHLLLDRCHQALRRTSGIVLTLAVYHANDHSLSWLGIGNVEGVLVRADRYARPGCEFVIPRGGVVGYRAPPPRISTLAVDPGDTLVLATDGVRPGFVDALRDCPKRSRAGSPTPSPLAGEGWGEGVNSLDDSRNPPLPSPPPPGGRGPERSPRSLPGLPLNLDAPPQQIANDILARHAREGDDALVLVARFGPLEDGLGGQS